MNAIDRDMTSSFKRQLEEGGVPFSKILLFGSRARGDAAPESDVDILVVVNRCDPTIRKSIARAAWQVGFDAGAVLAPIVVTQEKFDQPQFSASMFAKNVFRDGVAI